MEFLAEAHNEICCILHTRNRMENGIFSVGMVQTIQINFYLLVDVRWQLWRRINAKHYFHL